MQKKKEKKKNLHRGNTAFIQYVKKNLDKLQLNRITNTLIIWQNVFFFVLQELSLLISIVTLSWLGPDDLSLVGPTGVQLLDFCCSSVLELVCCWVFVLVSSHWWILIYMFVVLIHWWVEVLHADRTTSMCKWTTAETRVRLLQRKNSWSAPPVIYYWPFHGDASVVVYSNCQCSSAFCLSLTHCSIYVG